MKLTIDVGGTFTDFVVIHDDGSVVIDKSLSTPADPTVGVFNGLSKLAAGANRELAEFLAEASTIVHGTTITTNALLTGTGSRTGLLATDGVSDLLLMRRGHRDDQFNSARPQPKPLVERARTLTVVERIDARGRVSVPMSNDDVAAAAAAFGKLDVESVAISFLHSYLNEEHEKRAQRILHDSLPGVYVTRSSELTPTARYFERTSTTVLNAYVGPVLERYLNLLEAKFREQGYDRPILIMQSNGGVVEITQASRNACATLLSGPAGAPVAAAALAGELGVSNVIVIDMGGTSFEASVSSGGQPAVSVGGEIAGNEHALPMIDISTIGAGGGSIGWVDKGGMLRVGPQSAGADPGPACYGRGGTAPTVSDADLILGYLNAEAISSGVSLDEAEAVTALRTVGEQLGLTPERVAEGIYRTINASMADSLRLATVASGRNPRDFALVAAGGAGAVHAVELAQELEIELVIVPREASVFCAFGMGMSDFRHDYVRPVKETPQAPACDDLEALYQEMETVGREALRAEGVPDEKIVLRRSADIRYFGQIHEIEIPVPSGDGPMTPPRLESLRDAFHRRHEVLYGHAMPGGSTEIFNLRVAAIGEMASSVFRSASVTAPQDDVKRMVTFDGLEHETPVLQGLLLPAGAHFDGPLIVEMPTTTLVVKPGYALHVAPGGSFMVHLESSTIDQVLNKLGGTK